MKRTALILIALLGLSACDSRPTFQDQKASMRPVASNKARLYMYRPNNIGQIVQPPVKLDGVPVRKAEPLTYTFIDIAPGSYVLTIETEAEKRLEFTARPAQEIFVKESPALGWIVPRLELESAPREKALPQLQRLRLSDVFGQPAPKAIKE